MTDAPSPPRTPRSGRPPAGPNGEARTRRVVIYLSPSERTALEARSALSARSVAAEAREVILEALRAARAKSGAS